MIARGHERRQRQPDRQRYGIADQNETQAPAQQALPERAAFLHQLLEWIRARGEPTARAPVQHGDRQERELAARIEKIGGIEGRHHEPGQGERVCQHGLSAQQQAAAVNAHHHRRTHDGRPAPRHQGIGKQEEGDKAGAAAAAHAQEPQRPPQHGGEHDQMLSGNGQNMNHAAANVAVPIFIGHGGAFAQEQGHRHTTLFGRQGILQCPLPPGADGHQPAGERARPAARQPAHAVRGFADEQLRANALILEKAGIIKFSRIGGSLRRHEPADHFHLVADVQIAQSATYHELGTAGDRQPFFLLFEARHLQDGACAVERIHGAQRVVRQLPDDGRLFLQDAANLRRHRLGRSEVADVIWAVEVAVRVMVRGAQGQAAQPEIDHIQSALAAQSSHGPRHERRQRDRQTDRDRESLIAVEDDSRRGGQRHRYERRLPNAHEERFAAGSRCRLGGDSLAWVRNGSHAGFSSEKFCGGGRQIAIKKIFSQSRPVTIA